MISEKQYDFLVFIGRFGPYHQGHHNLCLKALELSDYLIILVGSSHRPPELRNPWSFEQRKQMILNSFSDEDQESVIVMPMMDSPYNDDHWIMNVQTIVKGAVQAYAHVPHKKSKVSLIGHNKDHSSFYLQKFPQWGFLEMGKGIDLDATVVRNKYFSEIIYFKDPSSMELALPTGTSDFLKFHYPEADYRHIYEENSFTRKYKQQFEQLPYPPTFNTADAIVCCAGHILMVTRGAHPGKGLLALPGGYVNQYEKVRDSAIRELEEETKIQVPTAVLKGSITKEQFFDYPYRSSRGRIFTMAYLIELTNEPTLPKVKGSDDAMHAQWIALADLDPTKIFEDHYYLIQEMIGL